MTETHHEFSAPDPGALRSDPRIMQLFQRLQQMDPGLLAQAAALAGSGDAAGARRLLMRAMPEPSGEKGDSNG